MNSRENSRMSMAHRSNRPSEIDARSQPAGSTMVKSRAKTLRFQFQQESRFFDDEGKQTPGESSFQTNAVKPKSEAETEEEKNVQALKEAFLKASNLEEIDTNQHAFISVTKVHEIMQTILKPVLDKVKSEAEIGSDIKELISDLESKQNETARDLGLLRRGYKQFDDVNRQFSKLESDQKVHQGQADSQLRQLQSQIDSMKHEQERMQRQIEVDQYRFDKLQELIDKGDKRLQEYKEAQVETLSMYSEEFRTRFKIADEVLEEAVNLAKVVKEQNHEIFGRLEDIEVKVETALKKSREVNDLAHETAKSKLDAKIYDRQIEKLIGTIDQMQKRMLEDESENRLFGEFVLRYQPLILQNILIESLNESLDYESLDRFLTYSEEKMLDFKMNHLNKKIQPLFLAKHYRDNLLSDYENIREKADQNLEEKRVKYMANKEKEQALQDQKAQELLDLASSKFTRGLDELEAKTRKKINHENQRLINMQQELEQKVNGSIFKNEESSKRHYSKIQRQISTLLEEIDELKANIAEGVSFIGKGSSHHGKIESSESSPVRRRRGDGSSKLSRLKKRETTDDFSSKIKKKKTRNQKDSSKIDSPDVGSKAHSPEKTEELPTQLEIKVHQEKIQEEREEDELSHALQRSKSIEEEEKQQPPHSSLILKRGGNPLKLPSIENSEDEAESPRDKRRKSKRISKTAAQNTQGSASHDSRNSRKSKANFKKSTLQNATNSSIEGEDDSDYDSFYTDEDSHEPMMAANVDLSNYYTKDECQRFVREEVLKVVSRVEADEKEDFEKLKSLIKQANERISQENKYTHQVEKKVENIDREVAARQQKLSENLEQILKQNQREKSDLQNNNIKLINRIDEAERKLQEVYDSLQSICTISLCLVETTCMQIRAEEQDEEDKVNIALIGSKGGADPEQTGTARDGVATTPRLDNVEGGGTLQQKLHGKYDFPEPVGTQIKPLRIELSLKQSKAFKDEGTELSPRTKMIKENAPKSRGVIALDPVCLSCSKMQSDIIKQFKTACLAYAPSPVVFRNIEFNRKQLLIFRKFLMGQCSKIVHLKQPFSGFGMSTKKIFDETYLYLKEINRAYLGQQSMDEINGMPAQTYQEITSQYWNLIYKHPTNMNLNNQSGSLSSGIGLTSTDQILAPATISSPTVTNQSFGAKNASKQLEHTNSQSFELNRAQTINIAGIDNEYYSSTGQPQQPGPQGGGNKNLIQFDFGLPHGKLHQATTPVHQTRQSSAGRAKAKFHAFGTTMTSPLQVAKANPVIAPQLRSKQEFTGFGQHRNSTRPTHSALISTDQEQSKGTFASGRNSFAVWKSSAKKLSEERAGAPTGIGMQYVDIPHTPVINKKQFSRLPNLAHEITKREKYSKQHNSHSVTK